MLKIKIDLWRAKGRTGCIKIDVKETMCECMDWTNLADVRDRRPAPINMLMNFRPVGMAGNFLVILGTISISRSSLLHGLTNRWYGMPQP
jgi:hypothetical protein